MAECMKNMLLDALTVHLEELLQTTITDETQATTVREGKLQKDPTKDTGINVLIYSEDESESDELFTEDGNNTTLRAPTYEIGGNGIYYYRFRIRFDMHFRGLQGDDGRSEARTRAYTVLSRTKNAIFTMPLPLHPETSAPRDDFDEAVFDVQVDDHYIRPSGGNNHYIWRGMMRFGYLVENSTQKFIGA